MIILFILLFILTFLWLIGIVCVVTKHKIFGQFFHDKFGWCYPDETITDAAGYTHLSLVTMIFNRLKTAKYYAMIIAENMRF